MLRCIKLGISSLTNRGQVHKTKKKASYVARVISEPHIRNSH